ncbi:hypothetical protein MGN70_008188 [Eutypa lata]|uniref:Succinate dehydrogenase assembly factor 2, mitochondrial n=1 Tax=Eutypa lata (strain UCR-EL1) TaxID=1287681 RepID=M7T5I5_EUTLA|nr:putative tpr repeat protein [Eutypa lata UCREL1]KAI1251127.1 hypothetical protein MGN70_008188 [Eutypa lata]
MAVSTVTRFMRPARRLAALSSRNVAAVITTTSIIRPLSSTPATLRVVPPEGNNAGEMGVGELEGAKFRVEPMRRVGEDDKTMRARLTYQSRKRGTLESDLLLSTFAETYLPRMTRAQMAQLDLFLDENDWDIYYWATQDPPSTTASSAAATPFSATTTSDPDYGSGAEAAIAAASSIDSGTTTTSSTTAGAIELETLGASAGAEDGTQKTEPYNNAGSGEWAQTVGTFKPAYRPVPARWRDSEVLRLLREHVRQQAGKRGGMAFMPALKH